MDSLIIGLAIVVALYVAVRLVLRHYFPAGWVAPFAYEVLE
jgi:hypothetical protein